MPSLPVKKQQAPQANTGLLVLGNQLFAPKHVVRAGVQRVFMREDWELCTYFRFHQHKLVFFLTAMRHYADELRQAGLHVTYQTLQKDQAPYEQHLLAWLQQQRLSALCHWEIEDAWFARRIQKALDDVSVPIRLLRSPMFLTSREQFGAYLRKQKRPLMRVFYEQQRKRLQVLMTTDGTPKGGQYSFDADNRLPLPDSVPLPKVATPRPPAHLPAVRALVEAHFDDHPKAPPAPRGRTAKKTDDAPRSAAPSAFWLPLTRPAAKAWLSAFLRQRLAQFGPFEDALSPRGDVLFHSVLSPMLNVGLLLPDEVLQAALRHGEQNNVPLSSIEGFVRQIVGWREFIRGIDHHLGDAQRQRNHFGHRRALSRAWYEGNTGIPPLDQAIDKVRRLAWAHHIERLMVIGNLMLLCEIHPHQAYRWFMEMFVDSSDWVMGPNVFGMALFSDGGLFATKPYICGSNYLRKMGGHKKGPWCDAVDGLYWRFLQRHAQQFQHHPRLRMMVRSALSLRESRQATIFAAADKALGVLTA